MPTRPVGPSGRTPILLEDHDPNGNSILEDCSDYINKSGFGIVLAGNANATESSKFSICNAFEQDAAEKHRSWGSLARHLH